MTNPVTDRLLALAASECHLTQDEILAAIANPQWTAADRVHDWRNHVDDDVRVLWPDLSLDAQLVAFLDAAEGAHSEEWD